MKKREQMIEKLVGAGYDQKALRYWTNEKVEAAYVKVRGELISWEACCHWSQRWIHPKKQYPLKAPTDQELVALMIRHMKSNQKGGEN